MCSTNLKFQIEETAQKEHLLESQVYKNKGHEYRANRYPALCFKKLGLKWYLMLFFEPCVLFGMWEYYSLYFRSMLYTENLVQIDLSDNKRVQYDSKAILLAARCCNWMVRWSHFYIVHRAKIIDNTTPQFQSLRPHWVRSVFGVVSNTKFILFILAFHDFSSSGDHFDLPLV